MNKKISNIILVAILTIFGCESKPEITSETIVDICDSHCKKYGGEYSDMFKVDQNDNVECVCVGMILLDDFDLNVDDYISDADGGY